MTISGECFCGKVSYLINGKLSDARSCHCSRCRKAFNSQASACARVDPDTFEWTSGEKLLSSYVGKQGFGLQFCSVCGSTLCTLYNNRVHGITLGCVNGDPKIELDMHIYVGSKANWETIPDGIAQFETYPPENC